MATLQASCLRRQANDLLSRASYSPKKLALFHAVVALGGSLLIAALNYYLNLQIADTGGLAGVGLRTALTTVQAVLEFGVMIGLPFWEMGLVYATLLWRQETTARPADLLEGFRRFGTVLGLHLLQSGLFISLAMALFYICAAIFVMTPFSAPLLEMFTPLITEATTPADITASLTPEQMALAAKTMLPFLLLSGAVYLCLFIPLFYRLRFAKFEVMAGQRALTALLKSFHFTKGRFWSLIKLDLYFWWFYLLMGVCALLSYADVLLPQLGISLPFTSDAGYFVFYALSAICQGVLLWQAQASVQTTYCLAYETLQGPPES